MNVNALQTDKQIPIKLPEICAPRQELLRRFDKASEKRFIYIHAPGGCGKTVSTLLWLQKSGYHPIWLGLDIYDNTPAAFYRFFCSSLFSVMPQNESLARIIMESSFNDSPIENTQSKSYPGSLSTIGNMHLYWTTSISLQMRKY